jgi:hypothetical protein
MRANHPLSSIEHQVMWNRLINANAFLGGFRLWADDKRVPPNVPPRRAGAEPRSVGDLGHPER